MFRTTKPLATRVYVFVNATVVLLVLLGAFAAVNWDQMPNGPGEFLATRITVKNLIETTLFLFACIVSFRVFGLSRPELMAPFWKELLQVAKACSLASVFGLLFPLTSHSGAFSGRVLLYFLPVAIVACLCGRVVAHAVAHRVTRALTGRRDLIIVGSGARATGLYEHMRGPHHRNTRVLGFVDSPNGHLVSADIRKQMLGTLDDLEAILMKQPVDEVLIALPAKSCYDQIQATIQTCERAGVEAKYLSDVFQLSIARPRFEPDDEAPVVSLKVVQDGYRLLVKRGIDLVGATAGLIVFGPLMVAIAVAIKLTSPGPVIFVQERFGQNKRRFSMYKFRTMVANAEELQPLLESRNEKTGPIFKMREDPRITPLGRVLRLTSLDELPQLWNVLQSAMSLVGPRPMSVRDVSRFDAPGHMRRFSVKPGLTCLWQIGGRSNTSYTRWMELDLQYIDSWSLRLDLSILVRTVPAVIRGQGAA